MQITISFLRVNNQSYYLEFKIKVVEAYLNGEGSQKELAAKFKIPSDTTVNGGF